MILIDTSVWVSHFRQANPQLGNLLLQDEVLIHPMIIGELACDTPPNRSQTLADLKLLAPVKIATHEEVITLIERHQLFGMGCGWVDVNLLASVLLTPDARLWTLDKRLIKMAEQLGVAR
jgi:predicted nucleic acid-binding protein